MNTLEECAATATAELDPQVQSRFADDPLLTMRADLGLKVHAARHLAERRADGGACDGMSFLKDGVILYAPTDHSRRENFTLAHELGHWLVEKAPEIFDWLIRQPQPERALETLCDRIAQRLLLTDGAISRIAGQGPVQAQHVLDLYNSSQASLPACAIALAARLPCVGAILVVDSDAEFDQPVVGYASVRPDPVRGWPKVYPWPGQAVPPGHPLRHLVAGSSPGRTLRQRTFWSAPWGERAQFYMDAVTVTSRRAVGVLADTDLWRAERFHPVERREFDERPEQQINCCGQSRVVRGYPCSDCGQIRCPACGKCGCDRLNDELVLCRGCFLRYKPYLLVDGLCEDCR